MRKIFKKKIEFDLTEKETEIVESLCKKWKTSPEKSLKRLIRQYTEVSQGMPKGRKE